MSPTFFISAVPVLRRSVVTINQMANRTVSTDAIGTIQNIPGILFLSLLINFF
jgi:hypothetical protein